MPQRKNAKLAWGEKEALAAWQSLFRKGGSQAMSTSSVEVGTGTNNNTGSCHRGANVTGTSRACIAASLLLCAYYFPIEAK